jgi:hypothetical protein
MRSLPPQLVTVSSRRSQHPQLAWAVSSVKKVNSSVLKEAVIKNLPSVTQLA